MFAARRLPNATVLLLTILLLIVLSVGLSSCGWQLRGLGAQHNSLPLTLTISQPKSFSSAGSYDFVDALTMYSRQNGASVNGSKKNSSGEHDDKVASWAIDIVHYGLQERSSSLNRANRSQQRQLFAEVRYRLIPNKFDASNTQTAVYKASTVRFFRYDEANVLSTNRERQVITDEINRDLSRQLWAQLKRKVTESAISAAKPTINHSGQ